MCCILLVMPLRHGDAATQRYALEIPSQPLGSALTALARSVKRQLIFSDDLVAGQQAPSLSGEYELEVALTQLLKTTGLQAQFTDSGVIMIKREATRAVVTKPAVVPPSLPIEPEEILQTVYVTAEKRRENVQRVAASVTAISGEELSRQLAPQLDALVRSVPGVTVQSGPLGFQFYLRGLGTDRSNGVSPINVSVDSVYRGRREAISLPTYDLYAVEVLRGPQGMLYGRNASGGSINLISKAPQLDAFEASARVGAGNHDLLQGEGMVNLPVGDEVAVRVAGVATGHSGYLSNGADDLRNQSGRIKLRYQPSADLQLELASDYAHVGGHGAGAIDIGSIDLEHPWRSNEVAGRISTDMTSTWAHADWNLGPAHLVTVLSTSQLQFRQISYLAGNNVRLDNSEHQATAEVRLESGTGAHYKWMGGFYYLNEGLRSRNVDALRNDVLYVPQQDNRSYAAFGRVSVPLDERWRLTAGLRYSSDDMNLRRERYRNDALVQRDAGDQRLHALSYQAQLGFDVTPGAMLYADISTGFKLGGFATDAGGVLSTYPSEDVIAYALGIKSRWLDEQLQLNGEVFRYDYQHFQQFVVSASGTLAYSVPGTEVTGAELESRLRWTRRDELGASVAYLDSKLGTLVINQISYTGRPLPHAPSWSANLDYQHRFDMSSSWQLSAQGRVHYETQSWLGIDPLPEAREPAHTYSELNLLLEPVAAGRVDWDVSAYVHNIENHAVRQGLQYLGPQRALFIGPPRTWGVVLSMRF
ncbi:MAG: TonB-dependent receptor [Steroidobacteraceae bacterium]